jgi:hypothetical protein
MQSRLLFGPHEPVTTTAAAAAAASVAFTAMVSV